MKVIQKLTEFKSNSLVASLLLSVALVASAFIWSYSFFQAQDLRMRGVINVTGVAEKSVTADSADWVVTLQSAQRETKNAAVQDLKQQEQLLGQFLLDQKQDLKNFNKGEYQLESIDKTNQNGQSTGEIAGYKATISYRYVTSAVQKVANLSQALSSFALDHELTIVSSQPRYLFSGLDPLKTPLLEEAVKNAKDRAVSMTKISQTSPGRVVQASQGIFQVNSKGDNSVSDYGNFDTSSIDKTVRATVSVQFEIR